jgi:hypothetical protein
MEGFLVNAAMSAVRGICEATRGAVVAHFVGASEPGGCKVLDILAILVD